METNNNPFGSLLDEALKISASEAARELGADAESAEMPEVSENHRQKMEKLFRRAGGGAKRRVRVIRVIAIAAAITALLAASVLSVSAWRKRAINFYFDPSAENMEIRFTDGAGEYANEYVKFNYIPEDFVMTEDDSQNGVVMVTFKHMYSDLWIGICADGAGAHPSIDTEDAEIERLTVNGCDGLYVVGKDLGMLIWGDDRYVCSIDGNINKEEAIKIAENIQLFNGDWLTAGRRN